MCICRTEERASFLSMNFMFTMIHEMADVLLSSLLKFISVNTCCIIKGCRVYAIDENGRILLGKILERYIASVTLYFYITNAYSPCRNNRHYIDSINPNYTVPYS